MFENSSADHVITSMVNDAPSSSLILTQTESFQAQPHEEKVQKQANEAQGRHLDELGCVSETRATNVEKEEERGLSGVEHKNRSGRHPNITYGITQSSSTLISHAVEGLDDDGSDENGETELLLSNDRRLFEVSGHHLTNISHKSTSMQTLIHLIKGNLGTGILAMPDALRHSGLLTGCILLPMLAVVCIHCMHLLVWSSSELQERLHQPSLDYSMVGEFAFAQGPLCLRRLAKFARSTINAFLTITQIGFCCVYIVFISANIKQIIDCSFPNNVWDLHAYIGMITIPVMMLSMIKTLKSLYYPSLLSNLLILIGLTFILTYLLDDLPSASNRVQFTSLRELPLFIATSIYAFEGIGVVLPLHRNMQHPEDLGGYNGVLNTAMTLVTCLYVGMGFYGYLKYGDLVEGSITLNLPRKDPLAIAITLIFVIAIFLTYALMLYVPVELIWPHLVTKFSRFTHKKYIIYVFRGALVLVTLIFAALIPHIGLFISLVGALASSTLALIFPPLLHSLTFYETQSRLGLMKNMAIAVFGVVCFFTGSYASIEAILKELLRVPQHLAVFISHDEC